MTANRLLPVAKGADRAEEDDDGHHGSARRIQHQRGGANHRDAERDHDDIGNNEDDVERIHAGRPFAKERRAGIEPLHIQNADGNGGFQRE
jgi:hypothetical protein